VKTAVNAANVRGRNSAAIVVRQKISRKLLANAISVSSNNTISAASNSSNNRNNRVRRSQRAKERRNRAGAGADGVAAEAAARIIAPSVRKTRRSNSAWRRRPRRRALNVLTENHRSPKVAADASVVFAGVVAAAGVAMVAAAEIRAAAVRRARRAANESALRRRPSSD
jgi:CCR4-NOT transcriptional regulation complex NOT5 subunit